MVRQSRRKYILTGAAALTSLAGCVRRAPDDDNSIGGDGSDDEMIDPGDGYFDGIDTGDSETQENETEDDQQTGDGDSDSIELDPETPDGVTVEEIQGPSGRLLTGWDPSDPDSVGAIRLYTSEGETREIPGDRMSQEEREAFQELVADIDFTREVLLCIESSGPTSCAEIATEALSVTETQITGRARVYDGSLTGEMCGESITQPSVFLRISFDVEFGNPVTTVSITITNGWGEYDTFRSQTS